MKILLIEELVKLKYKQLYNNLNNDKAAGVDGLINEYIKPTASLLLRSV